MDNDDQFANAGQEKFSDNPEENLQIENEILRMKVKAELGGIYEGSESLPPEIENEFLKNILAFEHRFATTQMVKVFNLLGEPVIKKATDLDDDGINAALEDLEELLEQKNIVVEFLQPRDNRFKYTFITEELFDHETDDLQVEGVTKYFTYEDFHPDHEAEIREQTLQFLSDWFERKMDAANSYLSEEFIQPDGKILTKEELIKKINLVFAAYTDFEESKYALSEIKYDLNSNAGNSNEGMGFSEGLVKYIAILENGDRKEMEGPFKFYFSRAYGCWSIFFFYLTGFNS
jgi:hypothetical protein